jgi:F-type H+-transporting ATPase subunit a
LSPSLCHLLAAGDPLLHVQDGWRYLELFGFTKQVFLFFVAGGLTLLFFWSYARVAGQKAVPGRWGNFVEMVLEFLRDQMIRPFMGPAGDKYLPLIASFFVYILICNVMGMVPFLDFLGHGSNTATGNICITAGLAICSFCIYHGIGIREQGAGPYLKNIFPRVPIFVYPIIIPVEIMAHIVRPCALAIRLFANMLAGHTMMAVILGFTYAPAKILSAKGALSLVCMLSVTALSFLELLVAVIQAFVFAFLTTVFLSLAVHPEH